MPKIICPYCDKQMRSHEMSDYIECYTKNCIMYHGYFDNGVYLDLGVNVSLNDYNFPIILDDYYDEYSLKAGFAISSDFCDNALHIFNASQNIWTKVKYIPPNLENLKETIIFLEEIIRRLSKLEVYY